MNAKKAISEETKVVKQLDAERRAFKETPNGRRPPSPPISTKSSFVFQPLDDYQTSSSGPMDDPDVQRPSSRDNASRRLTRSGQVGTQLGSHRKMGVGLKVLQELVLLGVGERVVQQAGLTQESMHQLQERKGLVLEGLVQQIQL
ncbi:hypothetical protein K1719_019728 [Acacia pycnantha]|nr:hypothetical protein K1719_019728 [Acacia pycnantha]